MAGFNRKTWMKWHSYISMFFLPIALIYLITGILYLFDYKKTAEKETIEIKLSSSLPKSIKGMRMVAESELEKRGLELPEGKVRIRMGRLIWGKNTRPHIWLKRGRKVNTAKLTIRKPTLYGKLLSLHKGHGGKVFNLLGLIFGLFWFVIYLSGIVLAFKIKWLKNPAIYWLLAGTIVTVMAVQVSF